MTREEEIENKAIEKSAEYRFGQLYSYNNDVYSGFIQGAKWADDNPKSPWISVKDDLPCNHEELTEGDNTSCILTLNDCNECIVMCMWKSNRKWIWGRGDMLITHWMPIPELPKE